VQEVRKIRIFVASPSDVQAERDRMEAVRDALNQTLGARLGIAVELWRWEKDQRPKLGDVQALINEELDEADIVVALFWKKFGDPTKRAPSPTAEEVLRTIERWEKTKKPELLLYFCERPFLPDAKDLQEYGKVLEFKRLLGAKGCYKPYKEVGDFERLVAVHLDQAIHSVLDGARPARKPTKRSRKPGARKPSFDRERYLKHVEAKCGSVVLTGLLKDEAKAAVAIERIYVPLFVTRPQRTEKEHRERTIPDGDAFDALARELAMHGHRTKEAGAGISRDKRLPAKLDSRFDALVSAALLQAGAPEDEARDARTIRSLVARLFNPSGAPEPQLVGRLFHHIEIERALASARHLLIEGSAGSGKTTALRHLAMALVRALRGETNALPDFRGQPPLPVFVRLSDLRAWLQRKKRSERDASVLLAFLRDTEGRFGETEDWIELELESGELILLLDGLDEIPKEAERQQVADIVADFAVARATKRCRLALTSRPEGLTQAIPQALEQAGGLARCTVQPLADEQIEPFVRNWYLALVDDEADALRRKDDLVRRIQASQQLRELAGTPIMLTAIAVLHAAKGPLPERAAELYDHLVAALCHHWQVEKDAGDGALAGPLTLDQKRKFLQELAYRIHSESGEARGIPRKTALALARERFPSALRKKLDDEQCDEILETMAQRSGLVVHEGKRDFAFRHLQFQEFLTARRVCDISKDPAAELAPHLAESWWRRVIALAPPYMAIQSNARGAQLLEELGKHALAIADQRERVFALATLARSASDLAKFEVEELGEVMAGLAPRIADLVSDATQPGDLHDRVQIARALGTLDRDPRLAEDERWVLVPAGPFLMGGDDEGSGEDEKPVHRVDVPAFRIQRWPVTVAEYAQFVDPRGTKGYSTQRWWDPEGWDWRRSEGIERPENWETQVDGPGNLPVVGLSWWEAHAYCRWRSSLEPERPAWRLPTESEWEKAARGGEVLGAGEPNPAPKRIYPWGDAWDASRANTSESGLHRVTPVGCFHGGNGPYGAWDQAGNVWEWCEDRWHSSYEGAPENGEAWMEGASGGRVIRGGGFRYSARGARSAYRGRDRASNRGIDLGFRPAQAVTT
jgi:formylglycine-generating enzyme required for sulfatase activity